MTFILFLAALAAAVALLAVERRARELYGFAAGVFGLATVLLLFLGDIERPFVLALTIATAITAVSRIKHYHSGLKLTAADCPLIFAGTFRFLVVQYPAAATVVAVAGTALAAAAIMIVAHPGGDPLPLRVRAFAAFGGVMAIGIVARRSSYRTTIAEKRGFFSTFVMSLADVPAWWRRKRKLTVIDVASEALPLQQAVPARSSSRPHIVVIQHESLFDPRLYGLPVQPHIEAFFTSGMSGPLSVDIYGGGSWQSEFSFLTGLSSTSFGPDAYFIQQRAVGRIHHTLPRSLECQGYRMALISSCRREFLNYDAFYDCMGFTDRIFSDSIPPPFDVEVFEKSNSDRVFLKAAMRALENLVATSAGPCFTYILTNFNHGPHNRRLASDHCADAREFANAACADAQYIEYYARLCETVATWQLMRPHLHRILSGRPALVLHYGDHQPVMTRRIERTLALPPDPTRHLKTFYAAEALNFEIDAERIPLGAPLDLTFLGTALLQWSGLPLDPIWATRAHLLGLQSVTTDAALAQWKRQLLRTLLDQGLIDTN